MQYKIDNIPVKEFEIKFIATLENGETIDLSKLLLITPFLDRYKKFSPNAFTKIPDVIVKLNLEDAFWEFSDRCCEMMFGKDGNFPLSAIEEDADLHRDEILEETK